jgi:dihydroorotase-like cyclic amidohydrolase
MPSDTIATGTATKNASGCTSVRSMPKTARPHASVAAML